MLANRPLVVPDESRIELRLRAARDVDVYVALDGQETFAFTDADQVDVSASPRRLKLVEVPGARLLRGAAHQAQVGRGGSASPPRLAPAQRGPTRVIAGNT